MTAQPTKLAIDSEARLVIDWSDGARRSYSIAELRKACPCATCREKRAQPAPSPMSLPVLSPAETRPLKLMAMNPVGNYAYQLEFSDGHDTGIYTFELLQKLGEAA